MFCFLLAVALHESCAKSLVALRHRKVRTGDDDVWGWRRACPLHGVGRRGRCFAANSAVASLPSRRIARAARAGGAGGAPLLYFARICEPRRRCRCCCCCRRKGLEGGAEAHFGASRASRGGRMPGASRTQAQRARGAGLCRRRPHAVGEAQPDRHLFRHRRGDGRRYRRPRGWCVPTRSPAPAGAACAGRARRGRGASSHRAPAAGESSVLLHTYPKRLPSCMSSGGSRAYAKRRLDFADRASQQVWSARRSPSPPPRPRALARADPRARRRGLCAGRACGGGRAWPRCWSS